MRHAKSSWDEDALSDYDRPLNKRGNRDAPRMGRYLSELDLVPDQIVSSPAKRAQSTIKLASGEMGFNEESIVWNEDLYFRNGRAYLDAIRSMDVKSQIVMTVGHYPMVDEIVSILTGKVSIKHFATATIACLETDVKRWNEIEEGCCELLWMVKPKELSSDR